MKREPIFSFSFTKTATSVDGVLEAFRNTIAELRQVGSAHSEKAVAHAALAAQHAEAEAAATAEAERAATIAAKMEEIFQ